MPNTGAQYVDVVRQAIVRVGDRFGPRHSAEHRMADATRYWSDADQAAWRSNSHWRGADTFESDDEWLEIGAEHLRLVRQAVPDDVVDGVPELNILEWGVGGGANAVHFAPLAKTFVAVEVSAESLSECQHQVAMVATTPFHPVLVDLDQPEAVLELVRPDVDLLLCFYVLELVPSQDYALQLLRIFFKLLRPGGVAVVQVKYATGESRTHSRLRNYRRNLANMTTFRIDEFWIDAERVGFSPQSVVLVPQNRLDERYAYYSLRKPR